VLLAKTYIRPTSADVKPDARLSKNPGGAQEPCQRTLAAIWVYTALREKPAMAEVLS
jgi:hypothetical protein